jgi:hypothetical protein
MNHGAGTLDAIGWDAAAMSVAEQKAGCLCKLSRICSPRSSSSQQEDQGGCNSYSWTHGKLQSNTSPTRVTLEGPVRFGSFAVLPACHFLDIHPDLARALDRNGMRFNPPLALGRNPMGMAAFMARLLSSARRSRQVKGRFFGDIRWACDDRSRTLSHRRDRGLT